MKKRLLVILSVIFVLSMCLWAGCAKKNTSLLYPDMKIEQGAIKLTSLTKDMEIESGSADSFGTTIVVVENKNEAEEVVSATFKLFSYQTGAFIEGAEDTIAVDQEPNENDLTYVFKMPMSCQYDGMYVVAEGKFVRENTNVDFPDEPETIKFTIFGKNGKVGEFEIDYVNDDENLFGEKDPFQYFESVAVDPSSGARYYVDLKGNVIKEANPTAKIFTYEMYIGDDTEIYDDYIIYGDVLEAFELYDKDGKFIRSVNGYYTFGFSSNVDVDELYTWYVDGRYFVQYAERMPSDAKEYDFVAEQESYFGYQTVKYDLITKSYDLKDDKVRDVELNFLVDDVEIYSYEKSVVLAGQEIKDQKINGATIVQSFDKNGDVYVDLQAIAPGAYDVDYDSVNLYLYHGYEDVTVVQGKKVVARYSDFDYTDVYNTLVIGNTVLNMIGDSVHVYDLKGNFVKTFEDVIEWHPDWESCKLQVKLENSLVEYNCVDFVERIIYAYDEEKEYITEASAYVTIYNCGADEVFDTDDDTKTVVFYSTSMDRITLTSKQTIKIVNVDGFYLEADDGYTYCGIYKVSITTLGEGEPVETVDYYNIYYKYIY